MSYIYVATLGQRPEAITVAFDILASRYEFSTIVILHTDPLKSGIAEAFNGLKADLTRSYPHLEQTWIELRHTNQQPLLDIENDTTAMTYFWGVCEALSSYKQQGHHIHLMVAGGRKAMSIYAVLAATLLLDDHDRVWTVITPHDMMQPNQFHMKPEERNHVQVIRLPMLPSRLILDGTQTSAADLQRYWHEQLNRRELLLSKLTTTQRKVAEAFSANPHATDRDIAKQFTLSERTIQRHMSDIFKIVKTIFNIDAETKHLRQVLIHLLNE